ncbi:MAG: cyclodeaminase/cyclohydrolase family protein [Synergistaceae bacterium]|nr:cyclodeaminase/cyclohydrolase family protein [Synergistaceae bacterium]
MDLKEQKINDFLETLSSSSPTPGGGSVSAIIGAVSSALISMVANLTVGKEKYKDSWAKMEDVLQEVTSLRSEFLALADSDIEAFNGFMAALRLPKETDLEKKLRAEAMEEASKKATLVPLQIVETCEKVSRLSLETAKFGNKMAATDAAIGAILAYAAAKSASYNVLINLPNIKDVSFVENAKCRLQTALKNVEIISAQAVEKVNETL